MLYDTPPAIIQRAEDWELDINRKMRPLGLSQQVQRSIVAELKRIEGSPSSILKPTLKDLDRYSRNPVLSHILVPIIGYNATPPIVGTYITFSALTPNQSTYTFTGQSLGTADASRKIIIVVFSPGDTATNSVTVAGISASLLYRAGDSGVQPEYWMAAVPTGTTGDVVVSMAASLVNLTIAIWRITGPSNISLFDGQKNGTGAVANPSLTIDSASNGFVIAAVRNINATAGFTWSGATERFDTTTETANLSAADAPAQDGGFTITATNPSQCRLTAISLWPG